MGNLKLAICKSCGKELTTIESFKCDFCQELFGMEHRLAESHNCPQAPERTPLGYWKAKPQFDDYVKQTQVLGVTTIKKQNRKKPLMKRLKSL